MGDNDILFLSQDRTLWGFADLHTHPAVHLGFGASSIDGGGLIWGLPGNAHTVANLEHDLPPCAADKHSGFDEDPVRHETRKTVLSNLHSDTGWPHTSRGWPSFSNWPSALSPSHQQMHVSWIHRAWRAGLRVMVASAVDNQVLSNLWHRHYSASAPFINTTFDYQSAIAQLTFIRNLVAANSSWMRIVLNSVDAYETIKAGKLAVILGLEMDKLTKSQILALMRDHGARLVTPIHVVNNRFGGVAVYEELFQTANFFLNGQFFRVRDDPNVTFRLSPFPKYLKYISGNPFDGGDLVKWGAMEPVQYPSQIYPAPDGVHGHRNEWGLTSEGDLKELMRSGMLIDVAHMSESCTSEVLSLSETFEFPVLDTHTGLRPASGKVASERHLRRDHATRIAKLGGMIGLGVERNPSASGTPIASWVSEYKDALDAMGGRSLGLGTDMNGLSLHIPNSEVGVDYPFAVGSSDERFDELILGQGHPVDFASRGLAQYGMLPEFLHAVQKTDQSGEAMRSLYSSAHSLVRTWELVESASKQVA